MTRRRPLIGLTLDSEEAGSYSSFPFYAVRQNYMGRVAQAGGLPVGLPHEVERTPGYLDEIDGLIVTGGGFDVDPALFGARGRQRHGLHQGPAHALRMAADPGRAGTRPARPGHLRRPAIC